jgi:AcrR family transcriptional regulator
MSVPTPSNRPATDARARRTQAALLGAFNRLLLTRGYDAISPATIASAAGVGRSTFYEHHAGKAALLRQSLTPILQPLAETMFRQEIRPSIEAILRHFWDNRRLARALLSDRPRQIVQARLADLIEDFMRGARYRAIVPVSMVAAQIAQGQLAMIEEWLSGRHACDAATLASALHIAAAASAVGLANSSQKGVPRR